MTPATPDKEREELLKQIEDALHITWAFKSMNLKPDKIQVLNLANKGYHTSYKDFVNNMADFILADRARAVEAFAKKTANGAADARYASCLVMNLAASPIRIRKKVRKADD